MGFARLAFVALGVFSMFVGPAAGDRLYLVPPADKLQQLRTAMRASQPNVSPEEIEKVVNPGGLALEDIKAKLAPAPSLTDAMGVYFQGRIEAVTRGVHGADWLDDANHNAFLFVAHGPGGRSVSEGRTLISSRKTYLVEHEFDTLDDFVYLLSDRHKRLRARFGSARHRKSIFALADPDGEMGLYQGEAGDDPDGVEEGRVTRYILEGSPQGEALFRTIRWSRWDPAYFLQLGLTPDTEIDMGAGEMLLGIARARRHAGYDAAFVDHAKAAIGILCTLVLTDPAQTEARNRPAAARAHQIGKGCYKTITSSLNGAPQLAHAMSRNTQLPVSQQEVSDAALDVLLTEPFFKRYLDADFIDNDPVPQDQVTLEDRVQGGGLSFLLTRELVTLAVSNSPQAAKARRMLVGLMYSDPDAGDGLAVDQRHFRSNLYDALLGDNAKAAQLAENTLCVHGWGHPNDSRPLVIIAFSAASAGARTPLSLARTRLLALMLQTARTRREDRLLAEMIEGLVGEYRQARAKGHSTERGRSFLDAFDRLIAEGLPCPRI